MIKYEIYFIQLYALPWTKNVSPTPLTPEEINSDWITLKKHLPKNLYYAIKKLTKKTNITLLIFYKKKKNKHMYVQFLPGGSRNECKRIVRINEYIKSLLLWLLLLSTRLTVSRGDHNVHDGRPWRFNPAVNVYGVCFYFYITQCCFMPREPSQTLSASTAQRIFSFYVPNVFATLILCDKKVFVIKTRRPFNARVDVN